MLSRSDTATVVFFLIIGWSFPGLGIGPQLIEAAFVPHLLFGLLLWGLCRIIFPRLPVDAG